MSTYKCDTCNKSFVSQYNLTRHYETISHKKNVKNNASPKVSTGTKKNIKLTGEQLRHNPDRLLPSGKKAKHVIDSYQTIDNIEIYYKTGDDCRKIFSYTLKEGDDRSTVIELLDALKPSIIIAELSKEMDKPGSNKIEIQRKINDLQRELDEKISNTKMVRNMKLATQYPFCMDLRGLCLGEIGYIL